MEAVFRNSLALALTLTMPARHVIILSKAATVSVCVRGDAGGGEDARFTN